MTQTAVSIQQRARPVLRRRLSRLQGGVLCILKALGQAAMSETQDESAQAVHPVWCTHSQVEHGLAFTRKGESKRMPVKKPKQAHTLGQESGLMFKDFRLLPANQKAVDEIKKIKPPKNDKELRAKMKEVATAVASALHTSPAVALSAYIDPSVWEEWGSATRRSRRSPAWSRVAVRAKKIEELLAQRFRARWEAVEADFAKGIDVAKAREHCFLASDSRTRLRIARRYYCLARATKFANSSTSEIVELCWAWFNPFQVFAYKSGNDLLEIGDQLEVLVGSEYVAMTWGLFENWPGYAESTASFDSAPQSIEEFYSCHSPHVYPLPDLTTVYGDVYEAIVYSYRGERLRVCKSIAEPFLEAERVGAMDEIEQSFLHNASEEGDDPRTWRVHFRCLTSFLVPEYARALIEADILGEAGSPEQKDDFRTLKEELKANGNGYLKRSPARIRR
jgi:hypothetical protein